MNSGKSEIGTPSNGRRNVGMLTLAQSGLVASSVTIVTFGGLFGKDIAPSPEWATLPISLSIASTALSTPLMSMLMGRVGRKLGFLTGSACGLTGFGLIILASFTGSFLLFCLGCVALGPFHASGQYYRFAALESAPIGKSGAAVSTVLMGSILAAFLVPALSGPGEGYFSSNPFGGIFVNAAFLIAIALMPIFMLRIPKTRFTMRDGEDGKSIQSPAPEPPRALLAIAKQPLYIVALCNAVGAQAMMTFVMTATPLAMDIYGFERMTAAEVIRAHVLAMYLPGLVSGRLIDRFGAVTMMFVGQSLFAAAFAVALNGVSELHFTIALILLGAGWNLCFVGATTLLTKTYRPSEASRAQGLNEFCVFGTSALGSGAAGVVLAQFGWGAVNFSVLAILAGTLTATLWYSLFKATDNQEV